MTKITLTDTSSGFNLAAINDNFDKLQDALNDGVLWRVNPTGEPNQMVGSTLDMNSNKLINLPAPSNSNDAARLQDVQDAIAAKAAAKFTEFDLYSFITADNVQGAVNQVADKIVSLVDNASVVDVMNYGADASGTTDSTSAFQQALATGKTVRFKGKFLVKGLVLSNGNALVGVNRKQSILYLADGANAHVITGTDTQDVVLDRFFIDGNKTNQGLGVDNPWRGIYINGDVQRISISNLQVDNIRDHGISLPYVGSSGGLDSTILYCTATNCGSADHVAAGGPGGTGIGAGAITSHVAFCYGAGNYLNGFKSASGNYFNCVSESNGGGFETGFVAANMLERIKYFGCRSRNNSGSGFRHQGEGHWIEMYGCDSHTNGSSGIDAFGNVLGLKVIGGNFFDNGQKGVRTTDTNGLDGITLYGGGSQAPSVVIIDGATFYDDQATATQEYGVYITDKTDNVTIGGNNYFGTHKISPYFLSVASETKNIRIRDFQGSPLSYRQTTTTTSSGTATQVVSSFTIPANAIILGSTVHVRAAGRTVGTAGTKIIRLQFNNTYIIISNQAASDQLNWAVDGSLIIGANALRSILTVSTSDSITSFSYSQTTALTIGIQVTCAGGDVVDVDSFSVSVE